MHRFYCAVARLDQPVIKITDPQEIRHIKTVLRLTKGDRIAVFNGHGEEAEGPIIRCGRYTVDIEPDRRRSRSTSAGSRISLACALPKKAKFELIVEKCTELGIAEIIPLITSRTEVRPDASRAGRKLARFRSVAVNAAKQSQRLTLPDIRPITPFTDFVPAIPNHTLGIIPCLEGHRKNLFDLIQEKPRPEKIVFLIGPEGDFTNQEIALAVDHGCRPASLGPTTLKVDTAAIAVAAVANIMLTQHQNNLQPESPK